VPVKSRFLVGVGAWLLGAAAATSGSMIAVNQLAHGLLGPQAQQLSEANLSVNPDAASDRHDPSAPGRGAADAARKGSAASRRRSAVKVAKSAAPVAKSAAPTPTPSPRQSLAGTLLQSPDGSVMAVCQTAGAYLQYWSPDQGFEADDVNRGPAAVASVSFEGPAGEVILRVSCVSGKPVAHLSHDD
jgi:hypothetical protein